MINRHSGIWSAAIRRPVGTLAMTSVVVVLGAFYLSRLPVDLLPSIVYPQVRATVTWPGVAPEVMEEQVTRRLEASLATTENVNRIESETTEGRSEVNLYFRYGTDVNFALQDASKNLDRVRSNLPEEADPATIFKFDPSQIPIYEVGFRSPERDPVEMGLWAERQLAPQLLTVEGVASVDVSGGIAREIRVTLDQERLRSYGLSIASILVALQRENQDIAAGNVTSESFEIIGKTSGKFNTVGDIESVLLPIGSTGQKIPLREVATVSDTSRDQRLWVRLDGERAVKISVRKQPDANTVEVADKVAAKIESLHLSRFIPDDVTYTTVFDGSFFIRNAVSSVRDAALAGAGLAMVVVLLFLGSLRKTIIVGVSIPLAVMATFMMMGMGGLTLNIMSLGGLALGVGMLVDNSIVMLENIFRRKQLDVHDPVEAAHVGAGEVGGAVVASTMTNLAAVVPFLLISGLSALIFRELILTISFAILASLAAALTLVPTLAALLARVRFSSGLERSRPKRTFDAWINGLTNLYRRVVRGAIRWRWGVLALAGALLVVSVRLTTGLGSEFLPTVDDGRIDVRVTMAAGTPPSRTNQVTTDLERLAREMPHVESIFTTAGGSLFGSFTSQRASRGSLTVQLTGSASRPTMSATAWVALFQKKVDSLGVPGARITVRPPRIRGLRTGSSDQPIVVNVQGDDARVLESIGGQLMRALQGVQGLEGLQPTTDEASPELSITLDRDRIALLGLNVSDVGQTVRVALDGAVPTRYVDGGNEFDVRVQLPRANFTSQEELGSIAVYPGGDRPVYLRDVARIERRNGPSTILRENQNRQFRITADVNTDVATVVDVNNAIRSRVVGLDLPEGYGIIIGGDEETIVENQRNLTIVTSLAVFLVFIVMAIQYERLMSPLVIMTAIPLSLIGVGFALWATDTPQSAPVLLGVILLVGIVVNNAILLVEYIEDRKREGMVAIEAAVEAGAARFRPILMTTLTTMLGMLPLALALGEGSELMQPLAIVVIGGLSVSMFLTLLVVPGVYLIFDNVTNWLRARLVGRS